MTRIDQILGVLQADVLQRIALDTKADNKVLKLSSDLVLKVLLYTILDGRKATLSAMEATFAAPVFQQAAGIRPGSKTRRNSLYDRISTIPSDYFRLLFEHCLQHFGQQLTMSRTVNGKNLIRFDSTLVDVGTRLLGITFRNGIKGAELKKVKFTIGFDGVFPQHARLYADQEHSSENRTLGPSVLDFEGFEANSVAVFDRGLDSRAIMDEIDRRAIAFVGRLRAGARHLTVCDYNSAFQSQDATSGTPLQGLIVESDQAVRLYSKKGKLSATVFRLIQFRITESGKPLWLVTNMVDEPWWMISELYRRRWDIEVFFKLLKSLLSFDHLAVRNENGLKVLLYTTLIAAVLIQVYRSANSIKGYKEAVLQFRNELEGMLLDAIIIACGGDPQKRTHSP